MAEAQLPTMGQFWERRGALRRAGDRSGVREANILGPETVRSRSPHLQRTGLYINSLYA